jgi:hypothetical protein
LKARYNKNLRFITMSYLRYNPKELTEELTEYRIFKSSENHSDGSKKYTSVGKSLA